jgi:hypothetical protein
MAAERNIERAVCEHARKQGWLAFKFVSPGATGVPDRIFISSDGRFILVEFKQPGGRLSALQKVVHDMLLKHQVEVHVVDSVVQGKALFSAP